MVVTITRSGYIKRTHVESYRSQRRGGKGVTGMETKEEVIVEDLFVASTHAYLLFFTNLGKVHWLRCTRSPRADARPRARRWSTSCPWARTSTWRPACPSAISL